jgi:hypothetical protein
MVLKLDVDHVVVILVMCLAMDGGLLVQRRESDTVSMVQRYYSIRRMVATN